MSVQTGGWARRILEDVRNAIRGARVRRSLQGQQFRRRRHRVPPREPWAMIHPTAAMPTRQTWMACPSRRRWPRRRGRYAPSVANRSSLGRLCSAGSSVCTALSWAMGGTGVTGTTTTHWRLSPTGWPELGGRRQAHQLRQQVHRVRPRHNGQQGARGPRGPPRHPEPSPLATGGPVGDSAGARSRRGFVLDVD